MASSIPPVLLVSASNQMCITALAPTIQPEELNTRPDSALETSPGLKYSQHSGKCVKLSNKPYIVQSCYENTKVFISQIFWVWNFV